MCRKDRRPGAVDDDYCTRIHGVGGKRPKTVTRRRKNRGTTTPSRPQPDFPRERIGIILKPPAGGCELAVSNFADTSLAYLPADSWARRIKQAEEATVQYIELIDDEQSSAPNARSTYWDTIVTLVLLASIPTARYAVMTLFMQALMSNLGAIAYL
jgi:hypothetical protein